MKTLIFPFCLVFSILAYAQKDDIAIIPEPVSLVKKEGSFNLKDNTVINLTGNDKDASKAVDYLTASISGATGFKWVVKNSAAGSAINLSIFKPIPDALRRWKQIRAAGKGAMRSTKGA